MSSGKDSFAVIGGEGFLGHAIVEALAAKYPGSRILSLDLVQRHYPSKGQWEFQTSDLTDLESLNGSLGRGTSSSSPITTVFHTASPWAMAGKEVCEKVNVQGSETVIEACKQSGVKKLVYTSSASVVYDELGLINVDERCVPPAKFWDHYSDTKARAESLILAANDHEGLLTCAIRPAGIFGPGDRQNIPGWIRAYKNGKYKFCMGHNENMFDWTYIDNVVHAHLLAAEKLGSRVHVGEFDERLKPVSLSVDRRQLPTSRTSPLPGDGGAQMIHDTQDVGKEDPPLPALRNRLDQWFDLKFVPAEERDAAFLPVAGEAYFISNGEPVPFWSWGRAIWHEYTGHHNRKMFALPPEVGLMYATAENWLCWLLGKQSAIPKTYITLSSSKRYYNIEKARRMLGYEPLVGLDEGLKRSIQWYKANEAEIEAALANPKSRSG